MLGKQIAEQGGVPGFLGVRHASTFRMGSIGHLHIDWIPGVMSKLEETVGGVLGWRESKHVGDLHSI